MLEIVHGSVGHLHLPSRACWHGQGTKAGKTWETGTSAHSGTSITPINVNSYGFIDTDQRLTLRMPGQSVPWYSRLAS